MEHKSMKKSVEAGALPETLLLQIEKYLAKNHIPEWEPWQMRECSCRAMTCTPMAAEGSLEEKLKSLDAGFTQTLLMRIDETGKKDSEIYKRANISKQHFSKIRNDLYYKPTKATAIALALALELDMEGTKDLIGRAGYALTNSSKFDLIVSYFIERGIFDVVQINLALYHFDQALLGGK